MTKDMGDQQWNYSDDSGHGPSEWAKYYPAGKNQSPINILVDYCDLHQSACNNCAAENHRQLAKRIESKPRLGASDDGADTKLAHQTRRGHLDSVGNDTNNDSDEPQCESDSPLDNVNRSPVSDKSADCRNRAPDGQQKLANDCLTLWKSKKLGPLQMRKPHHNHNQQQQQQQRAQYQKQPQTQKQNTRYCVTNKKIFLGYPRFLNTVKLCNTGHGWQVDMPPELARHTLLCGPPLADREYRLAQFHCHWGADAQHGSEHQINGQSHSAELHFVHWNCSDFASAAEAAKHKHGLAVLAVFVQALDGEHNRNKHLDKLMSGIEAVREQPHASVELENTKLDLKKLFPANRWDYATYEGSLTTPPLSEVVDWLVFLQPIQCSSSQVAEFRHLKCPSGPLTSNCRPLQAHNQRTVTIWTHSHSH